MSKSSGAQMDRWVLRRGLFAAGVGFLVGACGKDVRTDPSLQASGGSSVTPSGAGGSDSAAGGTLVGSGGGDGVLFPPDAGECLDTGNPGLGGSGNLAGGPGDVGFGGAIPAGPTVLRGAPLLFSPTFSSFGISAVVGAGDPGELYSCVRRKGDELWQSIPARRITANDAAEWKVNGLRAGSEYEYIVRRGTETLFAGRAVTERVAGESFRFALITDSHTSPRDVPAGSLETINFKEETLLAVAENIGKTNPDFVMHVGDVIDYHDWGFNIPTPSANHTRFAYLNYRRLYQEALGNFSHFPVMGNWEGENGNFTTEQIDTARNQRLIYEPAPQPDTYPEGGSPYEDYYAFKWGDALFIVLNVMTYTPTEHLLDGIGVADDWTLGKEQFDWFEKTLKRADSKWRFVFIHHTVGGKAGDLANSIYGRGGGLAAYVGEQARVHQLMLDHGVQIFFFGHDHVFTDMVVDGIHYTLPGSAGAPWKFGESDTGYAVYWEDSGHANVDVSPESVKVEFVSVSGEAFYSYQITK